MTVTMYDAIDVAAIPADASLVASYVDGYGGYNAAVTRFGASKCVSISVQNNDADVADVETGAMTPADLPGWIARQVARGVKRPVVYCNASTWPSVKAAVGSLDVSYWIADWTGSPFELTGADAVQYESLTAYDVSLVLPTFPFYPGAAPTPTPAPSDPTYGPPAGISVSVDPPVTVEANLTWKPAAAVSGLPAASEYEVYLYLGVANEAHTVKGFPTTTTALSMTLTGLAAGKLYIAHVVAAGADGAHVKADVYASAVFTA